MAFSHAAEAYLKSIEAQPAYAQRLVGVVEFHCAGTTLEDKTIRTLAAVVFKNLVKSKWTPEVLSWMCWCTYLHV